jgi:hypothetical protein
MLFIGVRWLSAWRTGPMPPVNKAMDECGAWARRHRASRHTNDGRARGGGRQARTSNDIADRGGVGEDIKDKLVGNLLVHGISVSRRGICGQRGKDDIGDSR